MTTAKRFTARQKVAPLISYEIEATYLAEPGSDEPERTVVHELTAIGVAPMVALSNMLDGIQGTTVGVKASVDFLRQTITDDSRATLEAILTDRRVVVDADLLTDIALWLLGEYGKRPTVPSSDSSDGRQPTGVGSTAN